MINEGAASIALAIVAAEKFNRNSLHQFAERTYAKLYGMIFGRLPDLSFGPAQVRISLLRRIAAQHPDWSDEIASWASKPDNQLLDLLERECDALKVATVFVLDQSVRLNNRNVEDVAAAYAGQRRRSTAPIDYAGIVEAMVRSMKREVPSAPPDLPSVAPKGNEPSPPMSNQPLPPEESSPRLPEPMK